MKFKLALLMLSTSMLAACESDDMPVALSPEALQIYLADKPEAAHHLYTSVANEGERNYVLNEDRAGLAALEIGDDAAAAKSFDEALLRIEAVYASNPDADKARSNFVQEKSKAFKGESYERAMTFYYRGLIYLRAGDYENARASFQGGQLQDAFAEDQQYQSDFAMLDVMSGWASQCNGDTQKAGEFYASARAARPSIFIPGPKDKILAVADIGTSPRKIGDGANKELLTYAPGDGYTETNTVFMAGGKATPAAQGEDLYWQATTRGGRQVDKILAGKAQFKEDTTQLADTTGQLGVAALQVAQQMQQTNYSQGYTDTSGTDAVAGIGLALSIFSIGASMVADAAKPEADTRYWDNLPARVDYLTIPGNVALTTVRFNDASGALVSEIPLDVRMDAKGSCGIAFGRSQRAAGVPASAPNSSLRR